MRATAVRMCASPQPSCARSARVTRSSTSVREPAPTSRWTGPAIQASATQLPFEDGAFDAALAILTVHHWPDRARGLVELTRVARSRVVIVTWDPATSGFWLVEDYFPEIIEIDRPIFPTLDELRAALGGIQIEPLLIPHDCTDGFLGAYWRRPEAYLDAGVRGAISTFTKLRDVEPGLARLRKDLTDGTWERRHGRLRKMTELDLGYRLVVAPSTKRPGHHPSCAGSRRAQ